MSVKRRDLIRYLGKNGFYLLREGGQHSIYTKEKKRFRKVYGVRKKIPEPILNLRWILQERSR